MASGEILCPIGTAGAEVITALRDEGAGTAAKWSEHDHHRGRWVKLRESPGQPDDRVRATNENLFGTGPPTSRLHHVLKLAQERSQLELA